MKLILLSEAGRESLTIDTRHWHVRGVLLGAVALLLVAGATLAGTWKQATAESRSLAAQHYWKAQFESEQLQLQSTRDQVEMEIDALTAKIASLQARIMRLDALGERVVEVAKLDKGEFDFSQPPAMGGPELQTEPGNAVVDAAAEVQREGAIYQLLDSLEARVEDREYQLSVLDRQIMARELRSESYVTGRPVTWGWLSSGFGHRTDPFNGKQAWHSGVDFAGKAGSDVIAVAAGVVTESGKRYGYGNMVEINHGNGLVTRYAHNQSHLVAVGDIVEKGQPIAKMGSTGRSTGPHVHFEVLRYGKPIDPERYIYRASL